MESIKNFCLSLGAGLLVASLLTGGLYTFSAVVTWDYQIHEHDFAMALRAVFVIALVIFTCIALSDPPFSTGGVVEPQPEYVREAFAEADRRIDEVLNPKPTIATEEDKAAYKERKELPPVQLHRGRNISLND